MKKLLSLIMVVIMMTIPMCVESHAAETDVNYDDLVAPCFVYLVNVLSAIEKGSLGFVTSTASASTLTSNLTITVTCSLQRFNSNSTWETYKSKSETFTGAGVHTVEKSWFAPAGYTYRTLSTVTVKNSAGTVLETGAQTSKTLAK